MNDILISREDNIMRVMDDWGRIDRYEVIEGKIPSEYNIWNAHLLEVDGKTYLKLYNSITSKDYKVDMNTLKALEVSNEYGKIIDKLLAGGRSPKEVKERLQNKDSYFRDYAKKIKPYIEELYGVKIAE